MAEELSVVRAIATQNSYPAVKRWAASANRIEGPTAFAQKRRPAWSPPEPLDESEPHSRL